MIPSMLPTPRDRRIIVTDLEGSETEAIWADNGAYAANDPDTVGGYWRTEAGYVRADEVMAWREVEPPTAPPS